MEKNKKQKALAADKTDAEEKQDKTVTTENNITSETETSKTEAVKKIDAGRTNASEVEKKSSTEKKSAVKKSEDKSQNAGKASDITKMFFIKFGILTGFIAVIFGILIYSAVLSRKFWQKNLKNCVEEVLDEYESNNWTVGNVKPIDNPFSVNAICYEATNRKTGQVYSAVLMRLVTFYGPVSVVFTVDEEEDVQMIGFSSLNGRVAYNLMSNRYSKRFEYWEKRIPQMIK